MKRHSLRLYDQWYNGVLEAILNLLEPNAESKVLDLGCGDGSFTVEVKKRMGCREIWGLDIYEPSIESAKLKGVRVLKWDLNSFPYPLPEGSFDVVISNQVLEHLFYPQQFLKEVHRILKRGGYTIISTENLASWDNVLALLLGFTPFSVEYDYPYAKLGNPLSPHNRKPFSGHPPHMRIFTLRALLELMQLVGLRVERVVGSGHVLGKPWEKIQKGRCRFITIKARRYAS